MSVDTPSTTKGLRRLSLTPGTINPTSPSSPRVSDGTFSPSHGKRMAVKRMSSISYIPPDSPASTIHLRSPPPAIQEVNEIAVPNPSHSLLLRRFASLPPPPAFQSSSLEGSTEVDRSEEHTSELQSHKELVCRLLLEKKKENTEICPPYTADFRTA